MKLIKKDQSFNLKNTDVLIVPVTTEDMDHLGLIVPESLKDLIKELNMTGFNATAGDCFYMPCKEAPGLLLCGMGKREKVSMESIRNSMAACVNQCRKRFITSPVVWLRSLGSVSEDDALLAAAESIYLANYEFSKYKSANPETDIPLLKEATFLTDAHDASKILSRTAVICENTLQCRDLVNETSDQSNAKNIAALARKIAGKSGIKCRIFGKEDIKKMNMGLLMAVNRASSVPPQLVHLTYKGDPKNKSCIAFVGKGITFDSGGMNLKPTGHIETMRMDMAGAATALYIIKAAAELKLKQNIHALLPLTDNMISPDSYRPGDVFTACNGKTVEICNTDAEGRLILADTLAYVDRKIKPELVIDIATLTGAALVALGETVAAVLGTDDIFISALSKAAENTGEKVWQLPIYEEFQECLKSDIADMTNTPPDRNAGTIVAAAFLKNFVGETPWVHIDIAGTAWYSKARGCSPKNATGYGVRLLIEALNHIHDSDISPE